MSSVWYFAYGSNMQAATQDPRTVATSAGSSLAKTSPTMIDRCGRKVGELSTMASWVRSYSAS